MLKRAAMMIGLIGFLGCGGGGGANGGNAQPSQQAVNGDIQGITSYILRLASDIDASSCGAFNASASTFPGVFPCTGDGDTTITIQTQDCTDGSPLNAEIVLNVALNNCSDQAGSIANGGFKASFQINGDSGQASVNSSNFEEDGIGYTLAITGSVDSQGAVTCGGSAMADGFSCEITQDCSSCLF